MLDIPPVVPAYLSSDVCTGALACALLIINMADINKISLVPRPHPKKEEGSDIHRALSWAYF